MDESNFPEEIRNWEHPPWSGITQIQGESQKDFQGESKGSLPPPQDSLLDAGEAINDFWSISENFNIPPSRWTQSQTLLAERRIIPYSTQIHWRLQNYAYEFGCQARATHRWLLEYRWIKRWFLWFVDRFHLVYSKWETSRRIYVVRERLTKRQLTSSPDHLWPELWRGMSKNAMLREKYKWAIEKPKLDNARRFRGIYFIDPEAMEFKEIIQNARRKLETAMPCKTCKKNKHGETRSKTNDFRCKFACILEASESTRMRMEESPPNYHEDHIAGKGDNSLQHCNLLHKLIPMLQAMKIPAAKAAVDKEWEKFEKISAWNLTKVRSKKEVIDEARTVHFASLMDICHLKNAELEAKHQKYKGRVVLRGDIVKDDSGSYALVTEQGSSASQMTAAKSHGYHFQIAWLRWTSSRRSISLYPGKNRRCSQIV